MSAETLLGMVKDFLSKANGAGDKEGESKEETRKEETSDLVSKTHEILERRRNLAKRRMRREQPSEEGKSDGELMSLLTLNVQMIPIDKVFIDPEFNYARVHEDPLHPEWFSNEGQHLADLEETMREEGLKDPIEVQMKGDEYMLRAGTRRWKAARKLGWKLIPATVIPPNIPLEWQYWSAVIRNTARKSLGTYEVALAAKTARDEFDTTATEFAKKAGYTTGYVSNLLRCIDNLPPYLLDQWRDGARVTLEQWITLSHLRHEDAIKLYRKWMGYTPTDRMRDVSKSARRKPLPPPRWLDRMMRLYIGVEGSDLTPRVRDHVLHAIEHCMGTRDGIPNVYEPKKHKIFEKKAELRRQLKMPDLPEPGEVKALPPPRGEIEENDDTPRIIQDAPRHTQEHLQGVRPKGVRARLRLLRAGRRDDNADPTDGDVQMQANRTDPRGARLRRLSDSDRKDGATSRPNESFRSTDGIPHRDLLEGGSRRAPARHLPPSGDHLNQSQEQRHQSWSGPDAPHRGPNLGGRREEDD